MQTIRRSALVEHSAARMFALVNDVAAYPRRFDWCEAAQVLEADDGRMVARLDLGFGALRTWFTTENTMAPPHHIDLKLVDGPFRSLSGRWEFHALDESACKVTLTLSFEPQGEAARAGDGDGLPGAGRPHGRRLRARRRPRRRGVMRVEVVRAWPRRFEAVDAGAARRCHAWPMRWLRPAGGDDAETVAYAVFGVRAERRDACCATATGSNCCGRCWPIRRKRGAGAQARRRRQK